MIEGEVNIPTADGLMATYFVRPAAAAQRPAIVLFIDAPGVREELLDMARRIAAAGYYCLVPDLYYRLGRIRLDLTRRSEAHAAVYRAMSASLANASVANDTAELLRFLATQAEVRKGSIGCLGFSIGGRFAMQAASLFPDEVAAAASVCGTGIVTNDNNSPHLVLDRARAELLFEFAEHDVQVPDTVIATLQAVLDDKRVHGTLHVIPGTQHGYSFPMRPMYNTAAAEETWKRVFALFARAVPARPA